MTAVDVRNVILAAVLVTALSGVQAQDTVQELADRWTAAYNTHDSERLGALYSDDARLMMHGASTIEGRDAIRDFWSADFKVDHPLTLLTVTHSVDGVDMILVHGNYRVVDRETGDDLGSGRFAHIWVLDEEGRWLIDRDLWHAPFEPYQ